MIASFLTIWAFAAAGYACNELTAGIELNSNINKLNSQLFEFAFLGSHANRQIVRSQWSQLATQFNTVTNADTQCISAIHLPGMMLSLATLLTTLSVNQKRLLEVSQEDPSDISAYAFATTLPGYDDDVNVPPYPIAQAPLETPAYVPEAYGSPPAPSKSSYSSSVKTLLSGTVSGLSGSHSVTASPTRTSSYVFPSYLFLSTSSTKNENIIERAFGGIRDGVGGVLHLVERVLRIPFGGGLDSDANAQLHQTHGQLSGLMADLQRMYNL